MSNVLKVSRINSGNCILSWERELKSPFPHFGPVSPVRAKEEGSLNDSCTWLNQLMNFVNQLLNSTMYSFGGSRGWRGGGRGRGTGGGGQYDGRVMVINHKSGPKGNDEVEGESERTTAGGN